MLVKRCIPKKYESLSSYIKRVAEANYCNQFKIKSLWKIPSHWSAARVNCNLTDQTCRAIKETANLTLEIVKALDIDHFGDDVWKCTSDNYLQIDRSNFVNDTKTKFCPQCLKENHYHKLFWQLKDILVCLEHHIALIECCVNCGSNVKVEDVIDGFCSKCGVNLEDAERKVCSENIITSNQVHLYKAYGIKLFDETEKTYDCADPDIKYYLHLYNFIFNYIIGNKRYFYRISNNMNIIKLNEYSEELQAAASVEKIIENSPAAFISLLDDILGAIKHKSFTNASDYILNPVMLIKDLKLGAFQRSYKYQSLFIAVKDYFNNHEKLTQFVKRFGDDIIGDKYITTKKAHFLLGIPEPDLKRLFRCFNSHEILDNPFSEMYRVFCFLDIQELYLFINCLSNLIEIVDDIHIDMGYSWFKSFRNFKETRHEIVDYAELYNFVICNRIKIYSIKYKAFHIDKLYLKTHLNEYSYQGYKELL